ncbi:hypothetical protein [Nonomuraea sp. CA-141351]|uniref:hypothetical protein n=1 Tax=Nonomuraea sp. CA-141351 TaxID=3239996 RepID=UPI003D94DD6E
MSPFIASASFAMAWSARRLIFSSSSGVTVTGSKPDMPWPSLFVGMACKSIKIA